MLLVAAEDNYNSEPAPKPGGEHSVIFGRTPPEERGREYLQLKKKKIRRRKMSLNEQIKQRMLQQQKSSKR